MEERNRRRTAMQAYFEGQNIAKFEPLAYIMQGKHDETWAVGLIQQAIEKPSQEAIVNRETLEQLMRESIPKMVDAERLFALTREAFLAPTTTGGRPLFFMQQDSAGGHGLARGKVADDQVAMKEEMQERGVVAFEQPILERPWLQLLVASDPSQQKRRDGRAHAPECKIPDVGGSPASGGHVRRAQAIQHVRAHLGDNIKVEGRETREQHAGVRSFWNTHQ